MDLEETLSTMSLPSSSDCKFSCSLDPGGSSSCVSWNRSVKRKNDEVEDVNGSSSVTPWYDLLFSNARVDIENECNVLREMVCNQQQMIEDLLVELEEEREAASSAANEAMTMILRLQTEKAGIEMEARQFKLFVEEKMAHDQEEIFVLEDLLYKTEQAIQSVTCKAYAYKHRMLSYGFTEAEVEGEEHQSFSRNPSMNENLDSPLLELPNFEYSPVKCILNEHPGPSEDKEDVVELEKYAFGDTPRGRNHLKNLEYRINEMQKSPHSHQPDGDFSSSKNVLEKVIVGQSPRRHRHRRFSMDSSSSFLMSRDVGPDFRAESPRLNSNNSFKKADCSSFPEEPSNLRKMDNASDFADDMSDRVYTIDSIYNGASYTGVVEPKGGMYDDSLSTPRQTLGWDNTSDPEMRRLYMRLQALEADRESLRQTILSMQTDKEQIVLLKEIAQHLCSEMTPERRASVKEPPLNGRFLFASMIKLVSLLGFWRKKARRSRYLSGHSPNAGLLMLLEKGPRSRPWRCLTRTQV